MTNLSNLTVSVNNDLKQKLFTLARKNGASVEECLNQALAEYVENWEDFYSSDLFSTSDEKVYFSSLRG